MFVNNIGKNIALLDKTAKNDILSNISRFIIFRVKKLKMARNVTPTFSEGCNKYLENCRQSNLKYDP